MSRTRVLLIPVLVLLLLPTAAHAGTAAPGGLQAAVDAAANGETIALAAGDYADSVSIPQAKTGLVLDGSAGARLTGPLAVAGTGTVLRAVVLAPTAGGLDVAATGGATLDKVLATDAGDEAAPIVAAGALAVTDSTVISTKGQALTLTGTPTAIVRSTIATTQASSNAIDLAGASTVAKALTADSSIVIGGATGGAGVAVRTTGAGTLPGTGPGAIGVALRHVTIAGKAGVVLDSTGATGTPLSGAVGAINAAVTGSIVHPASSAASSQLGGGAATLAFADSDAPGLPLSFTDAQVFGPNLRLRANAPVIGKGGALAAGESATDIDGQPRPNPTDIGADQFVNTAPTTGLTVSSGIIDEGGSITAALTPSDRDPGDTIPVYAFNWGDGTQTVGAAPTAAHTYAKAGVYTVKGAVSDARGAASNVSTAAVTVRDKSAPATTVTAPKAGTRFKYKRSRRLTIKGTDTDATGVAKIEIALTRKTGKRCFQYGKKTFSKARCSKYSWRRATLKDATFSLRTRKSVRLTKGKYTIRIRATDGVANVSKGYGSKSGTLVRFSVR